MKIQDFKERFSADAIRFNEKMALHTSFKIGGPVELLCIPKGIDEARSMLHLIKAAGIPYMVMGNGTNLLVPDHGLPGAVMKICEGFKALRVEEECIVAEAGCLLSSISALAVENALEGFEFASGIPGTLGGAVFMNAGAYGGEMQQVIKDVTVMTPDGDIICLSRENIDFGYRWSSIQDKGYIVMAASIQLKKGDETQIKERLKDLTFKRTTKQPLELPSAGSVFKRPEGHYAGQLIEEAGLRGLRYGDAQVSPKHCGFIVNAGHSNYKEVTHLIKTVQKIVKDTFGVELETEIRILE